MAIFATVGHGKTDRRNAHQRDIGKSAHQNSLKGSVSGKQGGENWVLATGDCFERWRLLVLRGPRKVSKVGKERGQEDTKQRGKQKTVLIRDRVSSNEH